VDSASLSGHTTYQTQLNESYWWENHVPTRLYLALQDIDQRLAGHERQVLSR